jgi:hypothetical protein
VVHHNSPRCLNDPVHTTDRRFAPRRRLMIINLLPDFLAVLRSTDRAAAYERYF